MGTSEQSILQWTEIQKFERTLANFFNTIAHGDRAHREWLLEQFQAFWGIKIPIEMVVASLRPF